LKRDGGIPLAGLLLFPDYQSLCGSRKYPYPHHRGSLQILRGRGVLKAKSFKGKYEPNLEFPEGWGFKPGKETLFEGVWIFSGTVH